MNIQPVGNKIIVRHIEAKDQVINGVVVPASTNKDLSEAIVVAVPVALSQIYKVGDKIIYSSGSGVGQIINQTPHLWLNHETQEIFGVIDSQRFVVDKHDEL